MKLYHGSNVEISEIKLEKCMPYKDFGKGFYTTALKYIEKVGVKYDK